MSSQAQVAELLNEWNALNVALYAPKGADRLDQIAGMVSPAAALAAGADRPSSSSGPNLGPIIWGMRLGRSYLEHPVVWWALLLGLVGLALVGSILIVKELAS